MAAHSQGVRAIPPVSPDQPPGAWAGWLREMAQSINLISSWAGGAPASGETGAITEIVAGTGLDGGGSAGSVALSLEVPVAVTNGGTGATSPSGALGNLGAAPLVSPGFTGTPTAPTPPPGDNDNSIATTAWVNGAVGSSGGGTITGVTAGAGLTGGGTVGTVTLNLSSPVSVANGGTGAATAPAALVSLGAAPLVSPGFSGTPTAPTAAGGTSTTQLATTQFVQSAVGSAGGGTITGVIAGAGLSGGGTVGTVTLSLAAAAAPPLYLGSTATLAPGTTGLVFCSFAAAGSVTLPSAPVSGQTLTIKDNAGLAGTAPITILPNSGTTIEGAPSLVLSRNWSWAQLAYTGFAWVQI